MVSLHRMRVSVPYTCPRCEYKSLKKVDILRHFNRVRPCACTNDQQLQLSQHIINIVLTDRIYHSPKASIKPNVTITQHNVNNYFTGPLDKLQALTEYKNIKMLTVDANINDKYMQKRVRYEKNPNVFYNKLTIIDLLQVLDELSMSTDPDHSDFNILYDKKRNKISYVEDDGEWKVSLVDKGLSLLLEKVKESFLDYYESYLIRKIRKKAEAELSTDLLHEYYKFIAAFHIQPITYAAQDSTILENDDDNLFSCVDEFYPIYRKIKQGLKDSERARIRKMTLDVITRNSCLNEDRLSTDLHNIFVKEDEFLKFLDSRSHANSFKGDEID